MSLRVRKTLRAALTSLVIDVCLVAEWRLNHASWTSIAPWAACFAALALIAVVRTWIFFGNPEKVDAWEAKILARKEERAGRVALWARQKDERPDR